MTSKGPGLYSFFGKKASDLLTKDYISDQKFTVSTTSVAGCTITSSASNKGGVSTGEVGGLGMLYNTLLNVNIDTKSNILTTLIFNDIIPSTKTIASYNFSDYDSGKLEVQYFHHHGSLSSAVALTQAPVVNVSASLGTLSVAVGAEAGYDTTARNFTKYSVGLSVTKPDSNASVILGDKGDSIKASYVHHLDQSKNYAAAAEISRKFSTNENTMTVGGSYPIDHLTLVKAKLNSYGILASAFQHEVVPKIVVTIASELDTKALDKSPTFGLAISLKP